MPVGRASVSGSPYVGVYLRVGDEVAIVPPSAPPALGREIERLLGVAVVSTLVSETELIGSLAVLNSHGVVVGDRLAARERELLRARVPVTELMLRENAVGNNVLANDFGALVHPAYTDPAIEKIAAALEVPVQRGTIAGLSTVGTAGCATNKGVVVHPKATEAELAQLGDLLKVPVARSTANFGVPVPGASIVANQRGMIVGLLTTPVEIVHLQEGFQIFD
ncbi:MAG: translation initiation factor IF-6 [Thermoplasmata archaeon]|nr:translation initiation factor IF-6 [Thermoplasmata archaeon]